MKERFYKILIIVICLGIVLALNTSCINMNLGFKKDKSNSLIQKDNKVRLVFWSRAATKHSITAKLIEKYNETNNDNVIIDYQAYGDNYKNVVNVALESGNPPDIIEINGGLTVTQMAQGGFIRPIDEYITEDLRVQTYPEVFTQKQFFYKGNMYAVPERSAYFGLFYNKELFRRAGLDPDRPPQTLEEMREFARKITHAGNGEYYGYGAALKSSVVWERFINNLSILEGKTGENGFDWTTGKFDFLKIKPYLQFLMEMDKDGSLYPDPLNLDIEVSRVLFGQGKIAMMIDGNWMPGIYNNNEIKNSVEWDVAPIPIFAGQKRAKGYMFFDMGKVITTNCKHPEKAWSFLEFMFNNQAEFIKNGEPFRTRTDVNKPEYIPANHKGRNGFTDMSKYKAFPFEVHTCFKIEGEDMSKVCKSIFLNQKDINERLEDLTNRYNTALEKAIDGNIIKKYDISLQGFDYFNR